MGIDITEISRGCERLVIRISIIKSDGTKLHQDIDFSGNSTNTAFWAARETIKAVNNLLENSKC